jgi:hypothetical protein
MHFARANLEETILGPNFMASYNAGMMWHKCPVELRLIISLLP